MTGACRHGPVSGWPSPSSSAGPATASSAKKVCSLVRCMPICHSLHAVQRGLCSITSPDQVMLALSCELSFTTAHLACCLIGCNQRLYLFGLSVGIKELGQLSPNCCNILTCTGLSSRLTFRNKLWVVLSGFTADCFLCDPSAAVILLQAAALSSNSFQFQPCFVDGLQANVVLCHTSEFCFMIPVLLHLPNIASAARSLHQILS